MSEIARKLKCNAMVFYEYKADDGAILREAADRIEELEKALDRQCDNMAFILNRVDLHNFNGKFDVELSEDRKLL